jgi:hypothetical protein
MNRWQADYPTEVSERPAFPDDFDDVFDVGGIAGNPAYFGLDVLRGLVDGIRDFNEVRQERWRRHRSLGTALLASSMWIDDPELIEAIGQLASASVIVTKQGQRPADRRKLEPLDALNERTPGMPIRAFSSLSGLAPTVDGQPALIGPDDRPDDTVVPTFRTLGWRKRKENVPIIHAKLALLGHLWWHDEDGTGMVADVIGYAPRRLWVSSANFTRSSRRSLEFGFWTEEQTLLDGAERFLVQLMALSEGVDPESDAFRSDLAPYEFDDEAMADYAAEFGWGIEDD